MTTFGVHVVVQTLDPRYVFQPSTFDVHMVVQALDPRYAFLFQTLSPNFSDIVDDLGIAF